jgi:hypothetical protein
MGKRITYISVWLIESDRNRGWEMSAEIISKRDSKC